LYGPFGVDQRSFKTDADFSNALLRLILGAEKVFYIGGWQIFGTSRQQAWDWSRSGLKRIASHAHETVVVEPTAAATNLIETDDDALELIRGEISAATFQTMGKDLVHVHVSDSNRALPGEARPRSTLNS
jgi:protein FrlC